MSTNLIPSNLPLSSELTKFLTQSINVYKINDYTLVEGQKTDGKYNNIGFKINKSSTMVYNISFLFNIFEESLTFEFEQKWERSIDEDLFKSIRALSSLISSNNILDQIASKIYNKIVTPKFKTDINGISSYTVNIPIFYSQNFEDSLKTLLKLASTTSSPTPFIAGLSLKPNNFYLNLSLLNNKININMLLIESISYKIISTISSNRYAKQIITINCKTIFDDVPIVSSQNNNLTFLNSSDYFIT